MKPDTFVNVKEENSFSFLIAYTPSIFIGHECVVSICSKLWTTKSFGGQPEMGIWLPVGKPIFFS